MSGASEDVISSSLLHTTPVKAREEHRIWRTSIDCLTYSVEIHACLWLTVVSGVVWGVMGGVVWGVMGRVVSGVVWGVGGGVMGGG